jgi:quercetin dioxygenase-like cupin family protein
VRILQLDGVPHRTIDAHGSRGFTIGAFGITAEASLVAVSLRPGGVIGRHPAAGRQLLLVLDGDATVSGSYGDPVSIRPGQAAVWEPNELHETRSTDGLTGLVIEGDVDVTDPGHVVDPGDV